MHDKAELGPTSLLNAAIEIREPPGRGGGRTGVGVFTFCCEGNNYNFDCFRYSNKSLEKQRSYYSSLHLVMGEKKKRIKYYQVLTKK